MKGFSLAQIFEFAKNDTALGRPVDVLSLIEKAEQELSDIQSEWDAALERLDANDASDKAYQASADAEKKQKVAESQAWSMAQGIKSLERELNEVQKLLRTDKLVKNERIRLAGFIERILSSLPRQQTEKAAS